MAVEDAPSLIVAAQPHRLPVAQATPTPPTPTATRSATTRSRATKEILGLPPDETFYVPDDVLELYREAGTQGPSHREAWQRAPRRTGTATARRSRRASPARASTGWDAKLPTLGRRARRSPPARPAARASTPSLDVVPGLLGGGADLTGNTGTELKGAERAVGRRAPGGRQMHFGVREHAMGGVMNGMAAPRRRASRSAARSSSSATTCAAPVRLAAHQRAPRSSTPGPTTRSGVGEDGPTHQPVEHLAVAAGHARPARRPPGRRQRDAPGLARSPRPRRPDRPHASAARTCPCSRAPPATRACSAAPTSLAELPGRDEPDVVLDRHRQRGVGLRRGRRGRSPARRRASGSCRCRAGSSSPSRTTSTSDAVLPAGRPHARRRGGAPRSAGTAGPTTSCRIDRFGAVRARQRWCSPSSASPPRTSPSGPASSSTDDRELNDRRSKETTHDPAPGPLPAAGARAPGSTTSAATGSATASSPAGSSAGVRGITSNPSIFQKAIEGQRRLRRAVRRRSSRRAARSRTPTGQVVTTDISDALAILRPVYDESDGADGFVLGRGGARTWPATPPAPSLPPATCTHDIDQPNLFVKIPGTAEGLPAIRPGHRRRASSVNVTLLFSLQRYDEVIEAYLSGLEAARRARWHRSRAWRRSSSAGSTPRSTSAWTPSAPEAALALRGKAAVANAQLAYQLFLERFSGPRWEALGRPRRPRAAAAVGVDLHEEPRLPRHALRRHAHRAGHRQHDARGHPRRLRGPRAPWPAPSTPTSTAPARCSTTSPRSASTSTRSPKQLEDEGVAAFEKSFDELLTSLQAKADALEGTLIASWPSPASSSSPMTSPVPSPSAWSRRSTDGPCDSFSIALSGGDTARRCYERLAEGGGTPDRLVEGRRVLGRRALRPARRRRLQLPPRPGGAARPGGCGQRHPPDALRRGPRPLPAPPRRPGPARPGPPGPRPRRPHRLAVPGLDRPRRRPRTAGRHERRPDSATTPTSA